MTPFTWSLSPTLFALCLIYHVFPLVRASQIHHYFSFSLSWTEFAGWWQNGLDTKVEKSRKQMKERKNRSKKIRGVKKVRSISICSVLFFSFFWIIAHCPDYYCLCLQTKAGDAAKAGKKKWVFCAFRCILDLVFEEGVSNIEIILVLFRDIAFFMSEMMFFVLELFQYVLTLELEDLTKGFWYEHWHENWLADFPRYFWYGWKLVLHWLSFFRFVILNPNVFFSGWI